MSRRRLLAVALAVLVVGSVVAPVAVGAVAAQSNGNGNGNGNGGGPPAHAGPPDHAAAAGFGEAQSNGNGNGNGNGGGPPAHAGPTRGLPEDVPNDAAAWSVGSDRSASTLSAEVGLREDGSVAINLTDDTDPSGREVSLNAATLVEAAGERPERVRGYDADSGEEWSAEVRYRNGSALFDVPHFSTQTVTFTAETSISATPATDGSQFVYQLPDMSSASDPTVNLTGRTAAEWNNESAAGFSPTGTTKSVTVEGNLDPVGPGPNDEVVVEVTGQRSEKVTPDLHWGFYEWENFTHDVSGQNEIGRICSVGTYLDSGALIIDGIDFGSVQIPSGGDCHTLSQTVDVSGKDSVEMEIYTSDGNGGTRDIITKSNTAPDGVTVTPDTDSYVEVGDLSPGETKNVTVPLTTETTSLYWQQSGVGWLSYDLRMKERAETVDPTVEVNGQSVTASGTLSDGETVTKTVDSSALVEGTNRVNVSVGDGSIGAGGPTPQVGLEYSHTSDSSVESQYTGGTWQETYNVSKTWVDTQSDATLTVPFSGNVAEVRSVEVSRNGSAWSDATTWSLDGTTLTVDLGTVEADETTAVRATGSKVIGNNVDIEVTDPTTPGEELSTRFSLSNLQDGAYIEVTGTRVGDRLHHITDETWSSGEAVAEFHPDGEQRVLLKNLSDGDSARIRTVPVNIVPDAGTAEAEVVTDSSPPEVRVKNVEGNSVTINLLDRSASSTWSLRDLGSTTTVQTTGADTSGVVSFSTDGDTTVYGFSEGSDDGGGAVAVAGVGGGGAVSTPSGSLGTLVVILAVGGAVVGFLYLGRRFGVSSNVSRLLLVGGGGVVGLVGVEAVTAQSVLSSVTSTVVEAISSGGASFLGSGAGSVVVAVALLLALYLVDTRLLSLPRWLFYGAVAALGIWLLDSLTSGALASGLGEISALVWLIILLGGVALAWRALRPTVVRIGNGGN